MKKKHEPDDDVATVITEITERGARIVEVFIEMDRADLLELLPELEQIRRRQDNFLEALEAIRKEGETS